MLERGRGLTGGLVMIASSLLGFVEPKGQKACYQIMEILICHSASFLANLVIQIFSDK